MFQDNLALLRRLHKMTQEDLAEQLGCTRQTLSKWETGESVPDLVQSRRLAEIFDVSLDELASGESNSPPLGLPKKGKHAFGRVTVGDKGQIVIPARARKIFDIHPGDGLFVLGDENQGIAIIKEEHFLHMLDELRKNTD